MSTSAQVKNYDNKRAFADADIMNDINVYIDNLDLALRKAQSHSNNALAQEAAAVAASIPLRILVFAIGIPLACTVCH